MVKTTEALFDGKVLHPDDMGGLKPNMRVRLVIETLPMEGEGLSFLRVARDLNLEGPSDWAENLESYLYGDERPV